MILAYLTGLQAVDTANDPGASASWLTAFSNWSVDLMETIGAPGAGVAIALENLFPPLPSEVVLPMAGLAASRGAFSIVEALFWTTMGSVVGAYVLYWLGATLGQKRLRAIAVKMPLMKGEDIDRTVAWFERHGGKAVFFGRMIPLFRSLISIPAGVTRMPLLRFGLLTFTGSLIWNSIFVFAGFFLGENWVIVEQYADVFSTLVVIAIVAAVTWFIVKRVLEFRAERRSATSDDGGQ